MRRSIVNTPLLYLNPCPLPVTSTGDKGPTRKNHHLASNSQFSPKGQRCATCDKQRQRGGFGDRRNLRGHSNRIDIHAGSRGSRDGFTPADGKGIERSSDGGGRRRGDLHVKLRIGGDDRTAAVKGVADGQRSGAVEGDPVIEGVSRASRENYRR